MADEKKTEEKASEKKAAASATPHGVDVPGPGQGLHAPSLDEEWKKAHAELVTKLESVKQELFDHRYPSEEAKKAAAEADAKKSAKNGNGKKSAKKAEAEDDDEPKASPKKETFPNPYQTNK